jgi:hypothetical protein
MTTDRTNAAWRKSTYSGNQGGDCVEVAPLQPEIGIRDSKVADSPVIATSAEAWSAFLDAQR